MKVKHAVYLEESELTSLTEPLIACCLTTYTSPALQEAALAAAKSDFETKLNVFIHKAFKAGKKIGKANADIKDALMYDIASADLPKIML